MPYGLQLFNSQSNLMFDSAIHSSTLFTAVEDYKISSNLSAYNSILQWKMVTDGQFDSTGLYTDLLNLSVNYPMYDYSLKLMFINVIKINPATGKDIQTTDRHPAYLLPTGLLRFYCNWNGSVAASTYRAGKGSSTTNINGINYDSTICYRTSFSMYVLTSGDNYASRI